MATAKSRNKYSSSVVNGMAFSKQRVWGDFVFAWLIKLRVTSFLSQFAFLRVWQKHFQTNINRVKDFKADDLQI